MEATVPADYPFPAALPAEVAALLAAPPGTAEGGEETHANAIDRAFAAVAFPPQVEGLLPAERLTPAQRALVETLVACNLWSPSCRGRLPDREDLRRWLGVDPPDPFQERVEFELGGVRHEEPLWRAVFLLQAEDRASKTESTDAFLSSLPLAQRYELWGRCALRFPPPWGLDGSLFFPIDSDPERCNPLITGSEHAWAARFLDRVPLVTGTDLRAISTLLPFLELTRAKVPVERRWYPLLPTSGRYDLVDEVLFAIPDEHRAEAVQHWLSRMLTADQVLRAVKRILPRLPDPAMLTRALEAIPKAMGSALLHRRALREAAGAHSELLALLEADDAASGPPMVLTLLDVRKPTRVDELSPEEQAQLLVAGKRYHGKTIPLEKLLNGDGDDEELRLFDLTVLTLGDAKGKHVYDGWLYMVDAGCFFAKGKPRVVAERVQRSITSKNEKLSDALETVLRAPLEPPPRKKAAAKKAKKL